MEPLMYYFAECRNRPFVWGEHDCVTFVATCLDLQHGTNYRHIVRSRFQCFGAGDYARLTKRIPLSERVTEIMGEPVSADKLKDGDLALISNGRLPSLGIVIWPVVFSPSDEGLLPVTFDRVIRGWTACRTH